MEVSENRFQSIDSAADFPYRNSTWFFSIQTRFNRIAVSDLEGARIIKPENIHCDAKIQNIFFDFCSNPKEMLDSLRRREFYAKMAELIKRLDHISFTEHDYNKFIKQSKFFLESLDKEHYRYEL
ncbi:MAG: hypothetical protein IJ673_06170 [Treponema sp.]|uniref:hypothetical protein n=1 Tax=Treponema sp. TaxID=166 RepID=UPI0025E81FD8|nr:hypothetical protein [Treponema sp.]MBQ8678899.1 hypothetical protein [Treponema sp.]MBR1615053.1 hypothetical protein [Treponema sp.]